jgi:hypothetical protein
MRKLHLLIVGLCFSCPWLLLLPAQAQESASDIIYSRFHHFRIPFQAGPGEQRLKQLQLFFSTDQGRSWKADAIAPPEQRFFRFMSERDGLYWFTVQTLDQEGRYYPVSMDAAQPSLKVVVDTQAPVITLRALPARAGQVGVSWDIRDDNLDTALSDALRLEYRTPGSVAWLMVPRNAGTTQAFWNPETNGLLEVRLRARDKAGNWGEAATTVSLSSQANSAFAADGPLGPTHEVSPVPVAGSFGAPVDPDRRLVNSKRISLNYELKDVGPSGVSNIELWYTLDGRSWSRYHLPKSGEEVQRPPLKFEVTSEGVYGFTLVAKSGVGLGERPPQVGDRPQIWVEVDLTKPVVALHNVIVGQGPDKGKLTIHWTARDKNLGREPITIAYAEQATGPWTPVVEKIQNTGRYVWSMPNPVPFQFLVRVEAIDLAGNVGEAVTQNVVKVDLSQPKVRILQVEPAGQ